MPKQNINKNGRDGFVLLLTGSSVVSGFLVMCSESFVFDRSVLSSENADRPEALVSVIDGTSFEEATDGIVGVFDSVVFWLSETSGFGVVSNGISSIRG